MVRPRRRDTCSASPRLYSMRGCLDGVHCLRNLLPPTPMDDTATIVYTVIAALVAAYIIRWKMDPVRLVS